MISGLAERAVSGWGGEDRRGLILAERCGAFRAAREASAR